MRLLQIDSSISGPLSVSRQLTASITAHLQQANPGLALTYRDLSAAPVAHLSEALQTKKLDAMKAAGALAGDIGALIATGQDNRDAIDPQLQQEFTEAETVLNEFVAANIVVIGAPMYNFAIPSQLKSWIDCLAAPGKTFRYSATGVEGLAGSKRLIVASSRGGFYSAPSPMAVLDHQESYLTGFFGFLGVTNITFVRAEGLNISAEQRQSALESALAAATALRAA